MEEKLGRRKAENVGREVDARLWDLGKNLALEKFHKARYTVLGYLSLKQLA